MNSCPGLGGPPTGLPSPVRMVQQHSQLVREPGAAEVPGTGSAGIGPVEAATGMLISCGLGTVPLTLPSCSCSVTLIRSEHPPTCSIASSLQPRRCRELPLPGCSAGSGCCAHDLCASACPAPQPPQLPVAHWVPHQGQSPHRACALKPRLRPGPAPAGSSRRTKGWASACLQGRQMQPA